MPRMASPFHQETVITFPIKQYFVIAPVIDQEGKKDEVSSTFLITGSFSSTADIHSMITAVTAAAFVPFHPVPVLFSAVSYLHLHFCLQYRRNQRCWKIYYQAPGLRVCHLG